MRDRLIPFRENESNDGDRATTREALQLDPKLPREFGCTIDSSTTSEIMGEIGKVDRYKGRGAAKSNGLRTL
jgi:hypothetical protein